MIDQLAKVDFSKFNLVSGIGFLWANGWWMASGLLIIGRLLGQHRLPWLVCIAPAIIYWSIIGWMISHVISLV